MKSLAQIYSRYQVEGDHGHGDKGTIHSYIPIYEKLLEPFRSQPCDFMEIGLAAGLSLSMWREYLPQARIVGVDVHLNFDPSPHNKGPGTRLIECDATKVNLLGQLGNVMFDVVIDDASHQSADQIKTFSLLQSRMKPGGLYIIEDVLNLEQTQANFAGIHQPVVIHDLRPLKHRFDDVLIVYSF